MAQDLRGWLRSRTPGVAWRDERLAERAAEVARLREAVAAAAARAEAEQDRAEAAQARAAGLEETVRSTRSARQEGSHRSGRTAPPSFRRHVLDLRRTIEELRPLDPEARHPLLRIPRKLRNYRLAQSHGIPVPEILGVWAGLEDLDLSGMPEAFVLKSDSGAGGRGVLPLRRDGAGGFRLVGGAQRFSQDEIVDHLRARSTWVGAPFFAERLLVQPDGGELPDDIKIYAFYGEVGMVLLRRMAQHADLGQATFRYLDGAGADLGEDIAPGRRIDPAIPAPARLEEFLAIARHLSRAMAVPFIRVDVYDTTLGPVLGELTRGPGGPQRYRAEHDEEMGRRWDLAQYRLDLDVVSGRPLRHLHGDRPAPDRYPSGAGSEHGAAESGEPVTVRCQEWCRG